MDYKHLYVDSDVLLDMLLVRKPFFEYTELLLAQSRYQNIKISTSALVIANINYIVTKKLGAAAAKEGIKNLVKLINVLPFEIDVINKALNSSFTDLEDAIQNFIAEKFKCEVIITRNIKDYKESSLPVYTTEQFLKAL